MYDGGGVGGREGGGEVVGWGVEGGFVVHI